MIGVGENDDEERSTIARSYWSSELELRGVSKYVSFPPSRTRGLRSASEGAAGDTIVGE